MESSGDFDKITKISDTITKIRAIQEKLETKETEKPEEISELTDILNKIYTTLDEELCNSIILEETKTSVQSENEPLQELTFKKTVEIKQNPKKLKKKPQETELNYKNCIEIVRIHDET